jgi:hypothetical protein
MEPKAFATDGYADNGVERDPRYEIPDTVLKAPSIRRLRILSVGAGITGIMNAYYIQKELNNVEHVIYEKNNDIGGVWYENRYPGCACDVPSHAYTLPFALNVSYHASAFGLFNLYLPVKSPTGHATSHPARRSGRTSIMCVILSISASI